VWCNHGNLSIELQLERYGELEQQLETALRDVQQQQLQIRQREAEVGWNRTACQNTTDFFPSLP